MTTSHLFTISALLFSVVAALAGASQEGPHLPFAARRFGTSGVSGQGQLMTRTTYVPDVPWPGHSVIRISRRSSDGCGPNPLDRLAQAIRLVTGEPMDPEDLAAELQRDPQLWHDLLVLLRVRQYHNCVITGDGVRF